MGRLPAKGGSLMARHPDPARQVRPAIAAHPPENPLVLVPFLDRAFSTVAIVNCVSE